MSNLPNRIARMVQILHRKGYCNIYLYSGMSPTGLNWRFIIGKMVNKSWPTDEHIASGSVRASGEVEWSDDTSTPEILALNFVEFYKISKPDIRLSHNEYTKWYSELLNMLDESKAPVFHSDSTAPHEYLLKYAPGYKCENN